MGLEAFDNETLWVGPTLVSFEFKHVLLATARISGCPLGWELRAVHDVAWSCTHTHGHHVGAEHLFVIKPFVAGDACSSVSCVVV